MSPLSHGTRTLPYVEEVGLRGEDLEVRLAVSAEEIDAAQALRYRVFYEEMGAIPSPEAAAAKRDHDAFDAVCDHLVIIDHALGDGPQSVVGTYRLLRRGGAAGGFYTEAEFDISPLLRVEGEILELGRSCVDAPHRNRSTMQLLWRGVANYVLKHDIRVMFGCASLPGTDLTQLAPALSYLYHYHLAPEPLRARALPGRFVEMNLLPANQVSAEAAIAQMDIRATVAALPPLLKGYLRLGGMIGDGAVIDHQFNTTDVCLIVATDSMTDKYFKHYIRNR